MIGEALSKQRHLQYVQWRGNNLPVVREFIKDEFLAIVNAGTPKAEIIVRFKDIGHIQRILPGWYFARYDGDDFIRVISYSEFSPNYDVLNKHDGRGKGDIREALTREQHVTYVQWTGNNSDEVRAFCGNWFLATVNDGKPDAEVVIRYGNGELQRVYRSWYLMKRESEETVHIRSFPSFHNAFDVMVVVGTDPWQSELEKAGMATAV